MTVEMDIKQLARELGQVRQELLALKNSVDQLGQAVRPGTSTQHPHIVRIPGVHGGRPVIRGTGVSVQAIVEQTRLGHAAEQITQDFDGILTLAQVYDALSYYYEHQAEIGQNIGDNREALWKGPQIPTSS